MSEWLGTGLQNRSHQFESGWHLKKVGKSKVIFPPFFDYLIFRLSNRVNVNFGVAPTNKLLKRYAPRTIKCEDTL